MNAVIGLDTNVLARYYVDDEPDAATLRQREGARRLIESGRPLTVSSEAAAGARIPEKNAAGRIAGAAARG